MVRYLLLGDDDVVRVLEGDGVIVDVVLRGDGRGGGDVLVAGAPPRERLARARGVGGRRRVGAVLDRLGLEDGFIPVLERYRELMVV